MATDLALPDAGSRWEPICRSLEELHSSQVALSEFFDRLFDELEVRRDELDERERGFATCQLQLDEREQQLLEQARQLDERQSEQAETPAPQSADLELERSALTAELLAAHDRAAELTDALAVEKRQAFEEHTRWTTELAESLAVVRQQAVDEYAERIAELTAALADEKRQATEERAQWTTEVKEMRRVIERQSELLIELASDRSMVAQAAARAAASALNRGAAPKAGTPTDPVIGSVMAQFELLQKERVERRGRL